MYERTDGRADIIFRIEGFRYKTFHALKYHGSCDTDPDKQSVAFLCSRFLLCDWFFGAFIGKCRNPIGHGWIARCSRFATPCVSLSLSDCVHADDVTLHRPHKDRKGYSLSNLKCVRTNSEEEELVGNSALNSEYRLTCVPVSA